MRTNHKSKAVKWLLAIKFTISGSGLVCGMKLAQDAVCSVQG